MATPPTYQSNPLASLPHATDALRHALGSNLIALLQPHELSELLANSSLLNLPPQSVLFREGEHQPNLFIVESGLVQLTIHIPGRTDIPILSVGPSELLAWSALLGQQTMTCSAITSQPTALILLPTHALSKITEQNPTFAAAFFHWLAQSLAHRLTATRLQLLDLFSNRTHP